MKRVFASGTGIVSSLGQSVGETWENVMAGKTGVRVMEDWRRFKGLHTHLGAPAPDVDVSRVPRSARRTMSRMSLMMVHAAFEALERAGLDLKDVDPSRVLICAGSTTGSPQTYKEYFFKAYETGGPEGQLGTSFFKVMNHSVASNLASALDFPGPVLSPSSACSTSAQAMILGWELVNGGVYDIVLAGGADELHHTSAEVFDIVFAASRGYNERPDEASRPFDRDRDGLVVSEGASMVVLESEASLRRRGGAAIGEVRGGAYTCAGAHMSRSDPDTMIQVMRRSIERAGLDEGAVGYVNAHATATLQGDQAEAEAIGRLFGPDIRVSSQKGHLGHSLAPCGAIEAILTFEMMNRGIALPTRNLRNVAPECQGVRHLHEPERHAFDVAVSTNFAFGGINTSLVLGKSPDL